MNYVPNESAKNLRSGENKQSKPYRLSILITRTDKDIDPFFNELICFIQSEINRNMCILMNVWYRSEFSYEDKCDELNLRQIVKDLYNENKSDGIIIVGKCNNESHFKGYQETLLMHNIETDLDYIIQTEITERDGYSAMEHIIQMPNKPTGIYCANDIIAIGMLKALNKYGNRYYNPSIISSDDISEAKYTNPMLTTLSLPKEEMAKFTVFLLIDRLNGGHKSVSRMELESRLIIRSSCYPVDNTDYCEYYI